MLSLLKYEITSRWVSVLGWGIGLFLFGTIYLSIYPDIAEQIAALSDWSIYQAMGFDVGTFEAYIGSTVVLFIPVILGIYSIVTSTQTLAGEEDDGTLELLLAMPLHRWQIVCAKALAIGLATFLILAIAGAGSGLVLKGLKVSVEVNITFQQLFIAVINGWPLTIVIVMMGLFLGAYLPNRRMAALTLTVIFIASYFIEPLAIHVESLAPIRPYSLFTYLDSSSNVFRVGVHAKDVLTLLGVAAVFFVLALLSFQRRNVTVGGWPWQRATKRDTK